MVVGKITECACIIMLYTVIMCHVKFIQNSLDAILKTMETLPYSKLSQKERSEISKVYAFLRGAFDNLMMVRRWAESHAERWPKLMEEVGEASWLILCNEKKLERDLESGRQK